MTGSFAAPMRSRLVWRAVLGVSAFAALTLSIAGFIRGGEAPPQARVAAHQKPAATAVAATDAGDRVSRADDSAAHVGLTESVYWQAGELVIDVEQMPLSQVVAVLAHATGTVISGAELLPEGPPVTVHHRGTLGTAWHAVLRPHASFSLVCIAAACRVSIVGAAVLGSGVVPAAAAPLHRPAQAAPTPEDAAARELERSQPDGSC